MATRQSDEYKDVLFARILEALDDMPEPVRLAFVLRHYQGLPIGEIAARIGSSETETEMMLRKAKEMLYSKLRPLALREKPSLKPDSRSLAGARPNQFKDLYRLLGACTSG